MAIFFHAQSSGFFDTRVHGERTLLIQDPQWVRPLISMPDPAWVPDSTEADAVHPLIQVEDSKARPPLIKVDNPDCFLPDASELVELSQDEYHAIFDAQRLGKIIIVEGGAPLTVDPAAPTWEQQKLEFTTAVQRLLDDTAKNAGYDDIKTAISYADEPAVARFQADGIAFRAWRSRVWEKCHEQLALAEAAYPDVPTVAELLAELPVLELQHVE